MRTRFIALAAGVAALSTPAFAADPIIYNPTPAPAAQAYAPAAAVYDWSGAYIGIQGGYAWTQLTPPAGFATQDFDGGSVGAYAGFNFQHDNFVFGLEGDANYNWNERTYGVAPLTATAGTDWDGSVRGRLGYAIDRTMVYGTGGIAFTRAFIEPAGLDRETETFTGWTVGAGVEHAFTDNLAARVEYRYTDFGRRDFGIAGADSDLHQHTVRVGLGYKF